LIAKLFVSDNSQIQFVVFIHSSFVTDELILAIDETHFCN
jgi:hypothetical protein